MSGLVRWFVVLEDHRFSVDDRSRAIVEATSRTGGCWEGNTVVVVKVSAMSCDQKVLRLKLTTRMVGDGVGFLRKYFNLYFKWVPCFLR